MQEKNLQSRREFFIRQIRHYLNLYKINFIEDDCETNSYYFRIQFDNDKGSCIRISDHMQNDKYSKTLTFLYNCGKNTPLNKTKIKIEKTILNFLKNYQLYSTKQILKSI